MVRMPGFGLDGPWRDNPAFAYVIEDASGITWLTGHPDQNPVEPYAVGDPNAGVHALNALLLALAAPAAHRARASESRRRWSTPRSTSPPSRSSSTPPTATCCSATGTAGPTAAPQNLYRTSELDEFGRPDDWVAIAVATDEQWADLVAALGDPDWATDELATAAGRRRHHDAIDEHLSRWCANANR